MPWVPEHTSRPQNLLTASRFMVKSMSLLWHCVRKTKALPDKYTDFLPPSFFLYPKTIISKSSQTIIQGKIYLEEARIGLQFTSHWILQISLHISRMMESFGWPSDGKPSIVYRPGYSALQKWPWLGQTVSCLFSYYLVAKSKRYLL